MQHPQLVADGNPPINIWPQANLRLVSPVLSAWFGFVQLGCCSRMHKLLPGLARTLEDPGREPLKPSSHIPLGTTSSPPVCWLGLCAPRKLCKEQHASPQPSLESRWLWEGAGGRTFLDKRRHGAAAL